MATNTDQFKIRFEKPEQNDYLYIDSKNKVHLLLPLSEWVANKELVGIAQMPPNTAKKLKDFFSGAAKELENYKNNLKKYISQLEEYSFRDLDEAKTMLPKIRGQLLQTEYYIGGLEIIASASEQERKELIDAAEENIKNGYAVKIYSIDSSENAVSKFSSAAFESKQLVNNLLNNLITPLSEDKLPKEKKFVDEVLIKTQLLLAEIDSYCNKNKIPKKNFTKFFNSKEFAVGLLEKIVAEYKGRAKAMEAIIFDHINNQEESKEFADGLIEKIVAEYNGDAKALEAIIFDHINNPEKSKEFADGLIEKIVAEYKGGAKTMEAIIFDQIKNKAEKDNTIFGNKIKLLSNKKTVNANNLNNLNLILGAQDQITRKISLVYNTLQAKALSDETFYVIESKEDNVLINKNQVNFRISDYFVNSKRLEKDTSAEVIANAKLLKEEDANSKSNLFEEIDIAKGFEAKIDKFLTENNAEGLVKFLLIKPSHGPANYSMLTPDIQKKICYSGDLPAIRNKLQKEGKLDSEKLLNIFNRDHMENEQRYSIATSSKSLSSFDLDKFIHSLEKTQSELGKKVNKSLTAISKLNKIKKAKVEFLLEKIEISRKQLDITKNKLYTDQKLREDAKKANLVGRMLNIFFAPNVDADLIADEVAVTDLNREITGFKEEIDRLEKPIKKEIIELENRIKACEELAGKYKELATEVRTFKKDFPLLQQNPMGRVLKKIDAIGLESPQKESLKKEIGLISYEDFEKQVSSKIKEQRDKIRNTVSTLPAFCYSDKAIAFFNSVRPDETQALASYLNKNYLNFDEFIHGEKPTVEEKKQIFALANLEPTLNLEQVSSNDAEETPISDEANVPEELLKDEVAGKIKCMEIKNSLKDMKAKEPSNNQNEQNRPTR